MDVPVQASPAFPDQGNPVKETSSGRRRSHAQGEMNLQMTPPDRRPQGGGKFKRQRIARNLLDLNEIISPTRSRSQTVRVGAQAYDPVELLEGAIDLMKCIQDDVSKAATGKTQEEEIKMQEAVLPQPLQTNMTSLSTSPFQDTDVMAGFQDCAQEVMRYLIEVENLPESHPVCLGLRQHLLEKQRLLDVETLLNTCQTQLSTGDSFHSYISSSPETDSSQEQQNEVKMSESAMICRTVPVVTLPEPKQENCSAFNLYSFLPPSSSIATTRSPHSNNRLAFIGQSSEDQSKATSSDFRALDLQQLAENNPEIACLTEEILGLLEDDDDDMSVFYDSEGYLDSDIEQ
ncbi:uncharacterized protein LOC135461914 [Liolophura sinensis]|uniref:uncharacterized protein LOC135461914 n=1 Tax=Liolophura sinensis TaxID=3198878 RepID=UPI003158D384